MSNNNLFVQARTAGQEDIEAPQIPPSQGGLGAEDVITPQAPRGTPSAVVTSDMARTTTLGNQAELNKLRKRLEEISKRLGKAGETAAKLKAKEVAKEAARKAETTEPLDPFQQQLQNAIDSLDNELASATDLLDAQSARFDAANQSLITSITASFARRKAQMELFNKQLLGGTRVAGIRAGRQRFAPEIQQSILSAEESAGLQRLANLDAQELALIAEANMANEDKQFAILNAKMEAIKETRNTKIQIIKDLHTITLQQEQAQREKVRFEREEQERQAEDIAISILDLLTDDPEENTEIIKKSADDALIPFSTLFSKVEQFQQAEKEGELDLEKKKLEIEKTRAQIEKLRKGKDPSQTDIEVFLSPQADEYLRLVIGEGGFVDINDWRDVRNLFSKEGGRINTFDDAFANYLSPSDRAKFGIGKAAGIKAILEEDEGQDLEKALEELNKPWWKKLF